VETHLSGADGRVDFATRESDRYSYFVLAEKGDDTAVDLSYQRFYRQGRPSQQTAALIYTDRSVYRPQQTIHWKVVAYRGGGEESTFRTLPRTSLNVELMDPNWQVVESQKVTANNFGSAAGEFEIPTGRLLGGWWIRTSIGGQIPVRIEEYKRPTFEVTVSEPEETLRLNREASLSGEVRYYFGLPVVTGSVVWRVEREPVYPRWWYWWFGDQSVESEIVAAGTTTLDADGKFQVSFVPGADERDASQGVTYRFRLHTDVTDEGGETRSASRAFRLGFVAVETAVESETTFFGVGRRIELEAVRTESRLDPCSSSTTPPREICCGRGGRPMSPPSRCFASGRTATRCCGGALCTTRRAGPGSCSPSSRPGSTGCTTRPSTISGRSSRPPRRSSSSKRGRRPWPCRRS
jgi:hypothetical protein